MSKSRLSALAGYRAGFLPNPTLAMSVGLLARRALASALFERISKLHLDTILLTAIVSVMNELLPLVELDSEIRDGQEQRRRCACDEECIAQGGGRRGA